MHCPDGACIAIEDDGQRSLCGRKFIDMLSGECNEIGKAGAILIWKYPCVFAKGHIGSSSEQGRTGDA